MIGAHARLLGARHPQIVPSEGRLVHVETPHVIDWLSASIATEDEQVRLAEHDRVAIATTWRLAHHRHDHPLGGRVTVSQVEQIKVIRSQTATYSKVQKKLFR